VDLRGSQNKDDIGRRLFNGFQQSVEGSRGKHMHLVDDIHLVFPFGRRIPYLVHDLPDIINTVVGGSIDLNDIHRGLRGDALAHPAFVAGVPVHRMLAVHDLS
jgi:hypothetical protein